MPTDQIGRYGIAAEAIEGQIVVTMHAELLTFDPADFQRWLFAGAAKALYEAKRQQEGQAA